MFEVFEVFEVLELAGAGVAEGSIEGRALDVDPLWLVEGVGVGVGARLISTLGAGVNVSLGTVSSV